MKINTMNSVILVISLLLQTACFTKRYPNTKDETCSIFVFIDAYKRSFPISYPNQDTLRLNKFRYVILKPYDCLGSFHIREYRSDNNTIVFEGSYRQKSDTIIIAKTPIDPSDPTIIVEDTFHYYIPVRDGLWRYYSEDGKLTKEEKY